MPDSAHLTLQRGGGGKYSRDIFRLLLLLKSILLTCRVSFYYFKHFSPQSFHIIVQMLIKLVACSEEKKMLFIRCVLAEHAESNCCLLRLVICFLQLLSLPRNIPPSKSNGFWGQKPEHRCQALELYCSQGVLVSLGLGTDPFLGWELDMSLSWILQDSVPLATESTLINC